MREIIDLKLGDIKEPLPNFIKRKFREIFKEINFYPRNYDLLIEKIAKKFRLKNENILLINGIDEGIDLITRTFGENILIFTPTYFEFFEAAKRNNLKITKINTFDGKEYKPEIKKGRLEKYSLIFLCNPNNPFGLFNIKKINEILQNAKGIVAIDECYIDFAGKSSIKLIKKFSNLLVLRSFSKGYSLAGLRIGFIVGNKKLIEKIREAKLSK